MFFYLAKGLWFLLQPSTLIALLIGYGAILIWTGWRGGGGGSLRSARSFSSSPAFRRSATR